MDNKSFRSTVLHGPDEADERERLIKADANALHRHAPYVGLRSPTRDFPARPPFEYSPPAHGANRTSLLQSPPRPPALLSHGLNRSPYMASSSSAAALASSAPNHHRHGHGPPVSPRHASSYFAPSSESSSQKPASGSYYDPTTDTTNERRVSDSWQASTPKVSPPGTQSTSFLPSTHAPTFPPCPSRRP